MLQHDGGKLKTSVDQAIIVPVQTTAAIQECHIVIGHIWCAIVDATLLKQPK
jgi:D-sedoheptulose 7-phosphate isomerase